MYFIYGTSNFFIENKVKKIIKKLSIEPIVFSEKETLEKIIMEIEIIPMFEEKKLIIFKNINAFIKNSEAEKLLITIKKMKEYITTIFIYNDDQPKVKNQLIKYLMSNANTIKLNKLKEKDIFKLIKKIVKQKNGTITNKAVINLAFKLPNNLQIIENEISKLILENKNISNEMVKKSISNYFKNDSFLLENSLISKDPLEIISAYNSRINNGDEIISIISSMSLILLLASDVNDYKQKGLSISDISKKIEVHIFRVKKSNELLNKIGYKKLQILLIKLSQLDIKIKTGIINPRIGLDQFILNFIK